MRKRVRHLFLICFLVLHSTSVMQNFRSSVTLNTPSAVPPEADQRIQHFWDQLLQASRWLEESSKQRVLENLKSLPEDAPLVVSPGHLFEGQLRPWPNSSQRKGISFFYGGFRKFLFLDDPFIQLHVHFATPASGCLLGVQMVFDPDKKDFLPTVWLEGRIQDNKNYDRAEETIRTTFVRFNSKDLRGGRFLPLLKEAILQEFREARLDSAETIQEMSRNSKDVMLEPLLSQPERQKQFLTYVKQSRNLRTHLTQSSWRTTPLFIGDQALPPLIVTGNFLRIAPTNTIAVPTIGNFTDPFDLVERFPKFNLLIGYLKNNAICLQDAGGNTVAWFQQGIVLVPRNANFEGREKLLEEIFITSVRLYQILERHLRESVVTTGTESSL